MVEFRIRGWVAPLLRFRRHDRIWRVPTGAPARRLALLVTLATVASTATVAAAAPSPTPSSAPQLISPGTGPVLDAVRAVDPRFAELPDPDQAQRQGDYASVLAGSWISAIDTFGQLAAIAPGPVVDDPWYGLGGSVVQVMLVADCVTEDVLSYLAEPAKGDPCGWRHTWLYRVSGSGEVTLLFDEGSPDTP